jgi:hypothetical protein
MRTTLVAIGAVGTLCLAVAACGGGGSGTSPVAAPAPTMSAMVIAPVTNGSGTTSKMTVSITIPSRTSHPNATARAALIAKLGNRATDQHIRTMSNTSPSASIRAVGTQLLAAGRAYTKSTGRAPEYVSPDTYYMELVLTSGATVAFDQPVQCQAQSNTCTATFNVPVGTNLTASLFLYDSCDYLLSAGATSNVTVTTSGPNNVNITLNGLVAYLEVEPQPQSTPFVGDPSQAQSNFPVTIIPVDADYQQILTPGTLIDNTFTSITSISVTPLTLDQNSNPVTNVDVTPSGSTSITVPANLTISQNYSYAGTGPESYIEWTASAVTSGSPLVPNVASGPGGTGYTANAPQTGTSTEPVTLVLLTWTNPLGYPITTQTGSPNFTQTWNYGNPTTAQIEFPSLLEAGPGSLGVNDSLPGYNGTITFTDNGQCSGVISYPTPMPYSTLQSSPYVLLTAYTLVAPESGCTVTASDGIGHSANLNVYYDNESLTIQGKARSK